MSAICPTHPDVAAQSTCSRCGRFCCDDCVRTRIDAKQFCIECWAKWRFDPLPWDGSFSPIAFLRAIGLAVFRPRRLTLLNSSTGSVARSLLFGAVCGALWFGAFRVLRGVGSAATWSALGRDATPATAEFIADLAAWALHYWWNQILVAVLCFTLDWLALRRWARAGELARAWALSLSHLTTVWLAVGLAWAGVGLASASSELRSGGGILLFAVPIWCLFSPFAWVFCRWRLLPWIAGERPTRARWMAVVSPVLAIVISMAVGAGLWVT